MGASKPRTPTLLNSPLAVGFATLLCGPVSGFWLLSYNDGRLRRRGNGWLMAAVARYGSCTTPSRSTGSAPTRWAGFSSSWTWPRSRRWPSSCTARRTAGSGRGGSRPRRGPTRSSAVFGCLLFLGSYVTPYALGEPKAKPAAFEVWDFGNDSR